MLVKKSAKGRVYYGCDKFPTCNFMTWDEPVPDKCPQCGAFKLPHRACKACGMYDGRQVLKVDEEKK